MGCDRCLQPGGTYRPHYWLVLHDECEDEWWQAVEMDRRHMLTITARTGHWRDDDPDELRARGVL